MYHNTTSLFERWPKNIPTQQSHMCIKTQRKKLEIYLKLWLFRVRVGRQRVKTLNWVCAVTTQHFIIVSPNAWRSIVFFFVFKCSLVGHMRHGTGAPPIIRSPASAILFLDLFFMNMRAAVPRLACAKRRAQGGASPLIHHKTKAIFLSPRRGRVTTPALLTSFHLPTPHSMTETLCLSWHEQCIITTINCRGE